MPWQAAFSVGWFLSAVVPYSILEAGIMARETEDHRELRNIASIGAKRILDGPAEFGGWQDRMMLDCGDQVRWVAVRTNQTPLTVLQQIYEYAARMAELMGRGERLAAISWMHRYADIVVAQVGLNAATSSAGEMPKSTVSTDPFKELCYHPATPKNYLAPVIIGLLAVLAVFVLITDPSAFLSSRLAVLSLVALIFLIFLGAVIGYAWLRERFNRSRPAGRR
jgi:hypothetical protein